MSRSGSELRKSEAQSKLIQDRITAIEKHLGILCDTLSSYTRKTARLRDKGDLLAKEIVNYAEYEKLNPSLKKGLTSFAEHLSAVQDYRQAEVQRLEAKTINPLSNYGLLCKQTKNELKTTFSAHDREQTQRKKLLKVQQKHPTDQQQINQAKSDLHKATVDATRTERALEQQMETFESKKLEDIKRILTDFVNIEMIFHAKALEVYTQCYHSLTVIEPEHDLEEFLKQIHPDIDSKRLSIASSASYGSKENIHTPKSTPSSLRKDQNGSQEIVPKQPSTPTKQQTSSKLTPSKQTPSKQTPTNGMASSQQSTPSKQSNSSSRPNSGHKPSQNTPPRSSKQQSSPARRIISVGMLQDVSDDDIEDDDDDEEEDEDGSEYVTDDDDDSEYDTTEQSTTHSPNGKVRK